MLRAGLVAVALALIAYFTFEPSVTMLVTNIGELLAVVALFSLVCLSEASQ